MNQNLKVMKKISVFIALIGIASIVSCKKDSIVDQPSINTVDVTTGSEFLNRNAPQIQEFNDGSFSIAGTEGTSIIVQGPFESLMTGDVIYGTPSFKLVEYRTPVEMMHAGIPTTANDQILETAGSFKLGVEIDGEPAKPFRVSFFVPSNNQQSEMTIFYGDEDDDSFWIETIPDSTSLADSLAWGQDTISGGSGTGYVGYTFPLAEWFSEDGYLFINCDHFPGSGLPLTDILVGISSDSEIACSHLEVSLLFNDIETYMPRTCWTVTEPDEFDFRNIPIGYGVKCIALGVNSEQELFFGTIDFDIAEDGSYSVIMESVSQEEVDAFLEGL